MNKKLEMKKISAEIIADSVSPQGDRITTLLLTYPRFIHGEVMTHRLFSRNSASSRAIPFKKMVKMVKKDPFIPIAWQKDHKGMQGTEYFTGWKEKILRQVWVTASKGAIFFATGLNKLGLTKQLCNRLLEPFMWHTVLVTATEWDNFFNLRCPQYTERAQFAGGVLKLKSKKDFIEGLEKGEDWDFYKWQFVNESQAEIHIQALAEAMWDVMNESTPKKLQAGEWHIPFGDKIDITPKSKIVTFEHNRLIDKYSNDMSFSIPTIDLRDLIEPLKVKIATARCARLSYMTFDGKIDYEKDIKLHDQLLESKHFSPFEHCARAMTQLEYRNFTKTTPYPDENGYTESEGWCNNFRGFIQYRYLVERNRIEK